MKIIECPRDAMQGIDEFIPTAKKADYINGLLKVGFDTIDFGSFVSPKAIPQMRDTAEVLNQLDLSDTVSKLLVIVANTRGAQEASQFEQIDLLGFPLSISETFQQRNTNKSIAASLQTVDEIRNICLQKNKKLVVYISMGFGNPYGDPYDVSIVNGFVDILNTLKVDVVSLADTIGASQPQQIKELFPPLIKQYPNLEFGVHLHSTAATVMEKIAAAYEAGCQRFDGALKGWGGCPMAKDDLTGNLPTEMIISYLDSKGVPPVINRTALANSLAMVDVTFPIH